MTEPDAFPDALDTEILGRLGAIHDRLDPPPPVLDDLVLLALGTAHLDAELARLVEQEGLVSARGESRTRSLRYTASAIDLLVTVVALDGGRVRLDGWLAPPTEVDIELRLLDAGVVALRTRSESTGRFSFDDVPRRSAQFMVRTAPRPVVTPAVAL